MTSDSSVVPGCLLRYLVRAATMAVSAASDAVVWANKEIELSFVGERGKKEPSSDLNDTTTHLVRVPEGAV